MMYTKPQEVCDYCLITEDDKTSNELLEGILESVPKHLKDSQTYD